MAEEGKVHKIRVHNDPLTSAVSFLPRAPVEVYNDEDAIKYNNGAFTVYGQSWVKTEGDANDSDDRVHFIGKVANGTIILRRVVNFSTFAPAPAQILNAQTSEDISQAANMIDTNTKRFMKNRDQKVKFASISEAVIPGKKRARH